MRSTQLFEQVVQHCWKRKKFLKACQRCAESHLNWFKLSFNIDSHFLCSWKCWMALKPFDHTVHPTFVQHPFNVCWTDVGQMLKPFKRALRGQTKEIPWVWWTCDLVLLCARDCPPWHQWNESLIPGEGFYISSKEITNDNVNNVTIPDKPIISPSFIKIITHSPH